MTVTYSLNVANARLTGFTKLLLRWKGSIYKLLYREVIIFCGLYYLLSMSYRYILSGQQKIIFEKIVDYCRSFTSVIPLSFVLGFYVSIVVTRWWQQFMQIPWPDKAVLLISGYVRGDDERGRIIRRTLARYLVLMQVLTFQAVSTSVRRRFPTLDHIQEVGLFTAEERMAYDEIIGTHGKWWVPAQWFISLIIRARRAGRIKADYLMDKIIEELHVYRTCCGMMFSYDWISIPLVYTQTVSIATYMYFAAAIIGRQYLDHREDQRTTSNDVDYYVPIFTILEFLCFMGWLKVAEQLINPYGEDDDDFELNWCLDRNLLVSYTIVDEMYNKHPKLVPDIFIDKKEPILPYTKSSISTKLNIHPHMGSTVNLAVEPEDFLPMETIMEEDHEDYNYSSPPTTSMVDYGNQQPSWFQPHHSVQIQMDPESAQQQHAHLHPKFPAKAAGSNVSRNHSELMEGLKADSNPPSRPTSRAGMRFLPDFIQDSRIVNLLFGSRSNSSQNPNANAHLPHHHYQNYSNLTKQHHQHYAQHANNPSTFLLKTPTKKLRHQQQPNTPLLNESSTTDLSRGARSNQPNQSLLVNSNTPFSMNASIGGNLNTMHNFNNTSLSATTMNNSQHLAGSHQNLVSGSSAAGGNLSAAGKTKPQSSRRNIVEHDDLSASDYDQRYESTTARNHRSLRLNRTSTLNQTPNAKYSNLPTAPVLSTFTSSGSSAAKSRMSPFMNRLRNSLNFSSHHYRNLNKLSARNKRSSFSSAISLKSKCDNPTADQLVTQNGFHFPPTYVPPKNPNQYLPLHLRRSQESASVLTLDQENELNNNLNNAANLNRTTDSNDTIEIKISPASRASHRNLNSAEPQSLANLEEENLIVMDDLSSRSEDKESEQPERKQEPDQAETAEQQREESRETGVEESRLRSQSSSYTIATAAEILKASNENELAKLKSSTKPSINNQDSQPLTSGTLTGGTLTENHSKSSSTRSSSTELNQDHEISNEKQSLLNKNETDPSCSSNEAAIAQLPTLAVEQPEEDEDEADENEKPYSPNEDCHEERYEESPTSSNDSLSPYESNQNTVSSYTQLLEKDKNNGEY